MKTLVILLITLALSIPAYADTDRVSYVAKERNDGKFCAKVTVHTVGAFDRKKTKCRTLAGWENAGYSVYPAINASIDWDAEPLKK